jgi:phosphoribosyl-ATP pyrophosphohydrolase
LGQACALCDLFSAKYDLVCAAWEVFCVQNDVVDFIDTLLRIVRNTKFNSNGDIKVKSTVNSRSKDQSNDNKISDSVDSRAKDAMQAMKQSEENARQAKASKDSAMLAVVKAKSELLRHSLEMMAKQGLVTQQAAIGLMQRAVDGDALVDAAIEAYASDRNVNEFLDTLQILANNSPEDLERIMRRAMGAGNDVDDADDEEESNNEDDDESSSSSTESANPREDRYADQSTSTAPTVSLYLTQDDINNFDLPQLELKHIVVTLAAQDIISSDIRDVLLNMIYNKDDRILACHDVYRYVFIILHVLLLCYLPSTYLSIL